MSSDDDCKKKAVSDFPESENGDGVSQANFKLKCSTRAAQCCTILRALRESSYTTFQIRTQFDIPHVGGRICDLRNAGYEIITTRCWDSMPGGELHFVALYTLLPQRQKELLL